MHPYPQQQHDKEKFIILVNVTRIYEDRRITILELFPPLSLRRGVSLRPNLIYPYFPLSCKVFQLELGILVGILVIEYVVNLVPVRAWHSLFSFLLFLKLCVLQYLMFIENFLFFILLLCLDVIPIDLVTFSTYKKSIIVYLTSINIFVL